jgi:hypothetical protein
MNPRLADGDGNRFTLHTPAEPVEECFFLRLDKDWTTSNPKIGRGKKPSLNFVPLAKAKLDAIDEELLAKFDSI